MKKINIIIFLLLGALLGLQKNANAQLRGYGLGTYPNPNFPWSSGTLFTDAIRAKVVNFSGMGSMTGSIDFINQTGTFNVGDILLLIQMKGGGIVGTHQGVEVMPGSTATNLIIDGYPAGDFLLNYSTSGLLDRVQVIKLEQYNNFILNGGLVTCNPWDDANGTGGVLAMMVNGTLTINGGLISAAAKGYSPDEAGIVWGTGSVGGAFNPTINLKNAVVTPPNTACMDGYGTVSVNRGDKGGAPGSVAASPTLNSGSPVFYGGSNKTAYLVMGDPGYFQSGYGGANGGQGGGWGGQGGNSNCAISNIGTAGVQGVNGLNGGNAGKGGRGGGAMIIKARVVNANKRAVVFDASGEPGQPGGNGGYGGAGGSGGAGGKGCCNNSTATPEGGIGGNGDTGAGGKGGDAGNGGASGYIWIGTTKFIKSLGNRAQHFGYFAGKGGKPGFGGWSAINTTPNSMSALNECTGATCSRPSTSGCAASVCNPDYAMCLLSSTTEKGNLIPGTINDYEFVNTPVSGGLVLGKYISKNNPDGDGDLEMYSNNNCGSITVYKAICKGDCDVLFKQLAVRAYVNNEYEVTMPTSGLTCSPILSFPFNINYIDVAQGNIPLLQFTHTDLNTPATLTDISGGSDHVGTFTSCFSLLGPGDGEEYTYSPYNPAPVQAPAGNPGVPGPPPAPPAPSGPGAPTDNVIIDEGDSWFTSGVAKVALNNPLNAVIYPNPADKDLFVELASENSNTMASISIKDVNGKELIITKQKLQKGNNKIALDVAKLKAGFYFINITANNQSSVLKITIQ